MGKQEKDSAFGKAFSIIAVIASISFLSSDSSSLEGWQPWLFVFIAAIVGYRIGEFVESLVVKALFIISSIILFLINAAVRRFIWDIISSLFGDG